MTAARKQVSTNWTKYGVTDCCAQKTLSAQQCLKHQFHVAFSILIIISGCAHVGEKPKAVNFSLVDRLDNAVDRQLTVS